MASKTWNTTALWDGGTKSSSSGNRELITVTDVVSGAVGAPAAGELALENKWSDKFDVADADSVTWKWANTNIPTATASTDIDTTTNNKCYMSVGTALVSTGTVYLGNSHNLSGDFTVTVKFDWGGSDSNESYNFMYFWIDANNYVAMGLERGLYDRVRNIAVINGVGQSLSVNNTTDATVQFRIKRVGNLVYMQYDLAQSDTFTTQRTFNSAYLNPVGYIYIQQWRANTAGNNTGNWHDYVLSVGTANAGQTPYRTSGNWKSDTITNGDTFSSIQIVTTDCNATNYVDKIEIYKSDDTLLSTYSGNITSNTTTTLTSANFDNGFTGTGVNYYLKLYLAGDGTKDASVSSLTVNYADSEDDMSIGGGMTVFNSGNMSISRDAKFGINVI